MSESGTSQWPNGRLRTSHWWIWTDRIPSPADEAEAFEALFSFELEGEVRPRRSEDSRPEEKMSSDMGWATYEYVLQALYPGQRLKFHFSTWRSGDNQPGLDWNIVRRPRAATMKEARRHAEPLGKTWPSCWTATPTIASGLGGTHAPVRTGLDIPPVHRIRARLAARRQHEGRAGAGYLCLPGRWTH